jgi:signal transduction histidine kinase/ActR/RegA family two-component response regulator
MPDFPPSPGRPKQKLNLVTLSRAAPEPPPRPVRARPVKPLPPLDSRLIDEAFGKLAAKISEAAGVGDTEAAALGVVHELVGSRACFISRYVADRELLQVSSVRGRNDSRIAAAVPGKGCVGRAYSEQAVVREDGVVAAPLCAGQSVAGCLAIVAPRYALPDELMMALARQVCAAADVARLRDEGARRTKDLQTAVAGLRSLEKTREELLSDVSHDLKNPLTAIKAYLEMLARPGLGTLNERQTKAVVSCQRSADRLLRMINELLLVSRLQSGKMQLADRPFGLKALAEEAAQSLASAAASAKVTLSVPASAEVFVRGDRDRVLEAVYALVENAIYQSAARGVVVVKVAAAAGGLAQLSVRDNGKGISAKELKHLFDTFHRTGAKGRRGHGGLGLALAAKVVHLHGGRVEAESKLGEGATLHLYLPMFAGAVNAPPTDIAAPREGDILVVEDDADCRDVLQQVLEMEGYRVTSVSSARAARALLAETRPALVLLDLRLSEEDGMSVLHFVRQTPRLADVAVYIISGARDLASLTEGRGLDRIDGFFEKPLQVPRVLDTVAAVVRPTRRLNPET